MAGTLSGFTFILIPWTSVKSCTWEIPLSLNYFLFKILRSTSLFFLLNIESIKNITAPRAAISSSKTVFTIFTLLEITSSARIFTVLLMASNKISPLSDTPPPIMINLEPNKFRIVDIPIPIYSPVSLTNS